MTRLASKPTCKRVVISGFGLILAGGTVDVVQAQTAQVQASTADPGDGKPSSLQEIIVSANKRKENLQDIPVSVTAISSDQLQKAGVDSTLSLGSQVAGLNMETSDSGFQPHLRGIGTTAISAGEENSVATYVDGVYIASLSGSLLQLSNINQIEVLKGPQGTLFGRNATGGVISITTLDPSQSFHGDATVGYGNLNTATFQGYVTGGLLPALAADLAVSFTDQGEGWGRNVYNGQEVNKSNNLAVRSKWLLTPADGHRITASVDYEQTTGPIFDTFRPAIGTATNYGPGANTAALRPDLAPYIAAGALSPATLVGQPFTYNGGFWDVDDYYQPEYTFESGGGSLTTEDDLGFATLTTISADRAAFTRVSYSQSPVPAPVLGAAWHQRSAQYSEEIQLASQQASVVKWVAGLFYLHAHDGYSPLSLYGQSILPLQSLSFEAVESTTSYAGYAQATTPLFIVPDTNLTLGIRYSSETRTITGDTVADFEPPLTFLNGDSSPTNSRSTFPSVTYRVALDHHFADDLLGYISVNKGFKSGVYNTIPPGGPDAVPVKPEILQAYEIGTKAEFFDHRVRFNSAAFFYNYSDIQVTVFNNVAAELENGASARLYGLDLDAQAKVTEQLTVTASAELLHDKFTNFPDAQFLVPQSPADGGGNTGLVGNATGNQLPYTPKYTGNLDIDYVVPTSFGNLDADVAYTYNHGFFAGPDNILRQPSYSTINGGLTWTAPNDKTRVTGWVKNATDKQYYAFMAASVNPGGVNDVVPAAPRTFGIRVNQKF